MFFETAWNSNSFWESHFLLLFFEQLKFHKVYRFLQNTTVSYGALTESQQNYNKNDPPRNTQFSQNFPYLLAALVKQNYKCVSQFQTFHLVPHEDKKKRNRLWKNFPDAFSN